MTRKTIDDLLLELLDLYAERKVMTGRACLPPDHLFREFEASFPYEETADQRRAINEVITDLTALKPMDRLISGDSLAVNLRCVGQKTVVTPCPQVSVKRCATGLFGHLNRSTPATLQRTFKQAGQCLLGALLCQMIEKYFGQ